jgi:hypothetical protein
MKTMEQRRMTYLEGRRDMREGSHIRRHGLGLKQASNEWAGWMDRISAGVFGLLSFMSYPLLSSSLGLRVQ